ncbi:hypothetical protein DYB28_002312, partial [Aphanomyces astaci]
ASKNPGAETPCHCGRQLAAPFASELARYRAIITWSKMRGNCDVTVKIAMADEGKKRKANEIAEDADDSVEEAEAPAQQVELVDLTAESDDDGGVTPSEDAADVAQRKADWEAKAAVKRERLGQLEQQAAADLVKSAMQTVGAEGVQKLLEQQLAREKPPRRQERPRK